jgi:1,4-alpha-glucan branching enzyme
MPSVPPQPPFLTDFDLHLLSQGSHFRSYEKMGAHIATHEGAVGVYFAVWAPNAERVSVIGDFNGWSDGAHPMQLQGSSGVWEAFVPHLGSGTLYKYAIRSRHKDYRVEKADPYAFAAEVTPRTASKVWDLSGYEWEDQEWMANRAKAQSPYAPMSIYEVHLGSWMRVPEEGNRSLSYREAAVRLTAYVKEMGFTHVEFLPLTEHPFGGSWGYQTVGYFASTSRFGTPQDLMFLVDALHRSGIGVILDWVPAHFPTDEHGLGFFDGTHLYEHSDPLQREHRDWGTYIFNYGRWEVSNFLISSALFWLDMYHIDALRVDAVASMIYLDYGRKPGEWTPNKYGGRENLEAIAFVRRFNEKVYAEYPDTITIAEESTSWPMVSRPVHLGGLGFGMKWNMGWMHDMLSYMSKDPIHRAYHHNNITFSLLYAFTENFVLPFSHDEVVHLKKSMISKMPGDVWQKFANLRLLYGYMYGHPGKKLLFMGDELGQWREWNHDSSVDWHLLRYPPHEGLQRWVKDVNDFYRSEPALHEIDFRPAGFEWIDCDDRALSVIAFLRYGGDREAPVAIACNFTPIPRHHYRIGLPRGGRWREALNSDATLYGGSGQGNFGGVEAQPRPHHGRPYSVPLTLPPLGLVVLKPEE